MPDITPTPHQQAALDWLLTKVLEGAPLIALRGYAGCGKTALVPLLRQRLTEHHIKTVVGSPTHRAAMILRRKGIMDASTVHEHALMPYFTPDYVRALRWLGDSAECKNEPLPHPDVDGVPWLVHTRCQAALETAKALPRQRPRVPGRKLLSSIGLHGQHFFDGFGPKKGEGVLIIDEASMVGKSMLDLCQKAYSQIIVVGDPGQLPPVKDQAVLSRVEGVDLTEIHRQAADSPIIQLAYRARQGENFWREPLTRFGDRSQSEIVEMSRADPAAFLESPLIVHRNTTRIACTKAIRKALGYTTRHLAVGEPLVCRSTSQQDRALGFYNNGLYRVVASDPAHPNLVTVEDSEGEEQDIHIHLEELDGENIHPDAIPFRFGYCLTAHTAQGGEWPVVYISQPDLLNYIKGCLARKQYEALTQWTYTAITRAKDQLCFLTQHQFERIETMTPNTSQTIAPPSAPMMTTRPATPGRDPVDPFATEVAGTAADEQLLQGPGAADDIPDPVVPNEAIAQKTAQNAQGSTIPPSAMVDTPSRPDGQERPIEPQALGFLQWLQGELRKTFDAEVLQTGEHLNRAFAFLAKCWETQTRGEVQSSALLGEALIQLQQRGLNTAPPTVAQVDAVSPEGFPVKFIVTKSRMMEPEESPEAGLLQVVPTLLGWLHANGYTPPVPSPVGSDAQF